MYLDYLKNNDIFENIREVKDIKKINHYKIVEAYDFDFLDLVITVGFTNTFPYEMPLYMIRNTTNQRLFAHVDETGYICSRNLSDLNYDVRNIQGIIDDSIEEIINILTMEEVEQKNEINREFSDYFTRNVNYTNVPNRIKFKGSAHESIFINSDGFSHEEITKLNVLDYENFSIITNSTKVDYTHLINHDKTIRTVYYIPLKEIPELPHYNTPLTTTNIINQIDKNNLRKILKKQIGNFEEYLLGYKYQDDYRYMYIKINNLNTGKRLIGTSNVKIYPERVNIITPEFLRTRGGTKSNQSKILLFGVGSLGSEVLSLLCKSGFRNITIVDDDHMSIYNTFRHVIGFNSLFEISSDKTKHISRYKVDILKVQMEMMYPGTDICVKRKTIQEYLMDDVSHLREHKYIISTTGNTIAEKMLNRVIYKDNINTKLIIAWLEAFGIGRHILLNDGKSKGCIECLLNSSHYVRFLKSYDFKIYEDTCIGSYTDFGAIDSVLLASEVVGCLLQFESGSEFKNRHIAKKGILKKSIDEKFINQMYYNETQSKLDLMEYDFYYEGCDCCG